MTDFLTNQQISPIESENIILLPFEMGDNLVDYTNWLNDPEINRYLEVKWMTHTIDTTLDYVLKQLNEKKVIFYKIIWKSNGIHIGNIQANNINLNHKTADIGYLIGNKNYQGLGAGTEAIKLIVKYLFSIGIYKINAGTYENNMGSVKALLKNSFICEGRQLNQKKNGVLRENTLIFGLENDPKQK